jgi:NAD(P)-dependent dehydrogenase (short-subunit alcohol dehydrogenase family)
MTDKIAFITGGATGIGLATARKLLAGGAFVVITGRRQEQLDAAVARLGDRAWGIRGDVADEPAMQAIFEAVGNRLGHIDTLVANAGMGTNAPLSKITQEQFEITFATNVRGVLNTVQKALPLMKVGSSVTILGSTAGTRPPAALSLYSASRAAVRAMLTSWIKDTKGSGIRMNIVSPGPVDTDLLRDDIALHTGPEGVQVQMDAMGQASPMGRVAMPEDIANAICFLAGPEASLIHGVELIVDGGLSIVS